MPPHDLIRILFLTHAFNSLTQRLFVSLAVDLERQQAGRQTDVADQPGRDVAAIRSRGAADDQQVGIAACIFGHLLPEDVAAVVDARDGRR